MTETIQQTHNRLMEMSLEELRDVYEEVYEELSTSRHKQYLIKRILWGMQAKEFGGLSCRARDKAKRMANLIDVRLTTPQEPLQVVKKDISQIYDSKPSSLPLGIQLERIYKGRRIVVTIVDNGIRYEGRLYRSLTAVAKEVTGSHTSGKLFFGLNKTGGKSA
ncbi:MAG: DUF2924 domain-containing protein [Sedimentisphaeraceae bacterium JB056]